MDGVLGKTPDRAMYWSGEDISELNIRREQPISDVLAILANAIIELKNEKFEIGTISKGTDGYVPRNEAIKVLVDKIGNLKTEDIKHSGIPFNNNRLSVEASKYLGTKLNYSVNTASSGSKIGINLSDGLNIDGDVLSTRVVVSGKSETGKNIFMDTPEKISSVTVNNSMYPIDIDVTTRVQTKTGIVDLSKKVVLYNPSESGDFSAIYDVKDRSFSGPFEGSLQDMIGSIEATQARLEVYHDALKNTDSGDILNTVKKQDSEITTLSGQVKGMETVRISIPGTDGKTSTKTVSPQQAINEITENLNQVQLENNLLKQKLEQAQNVLNNVSFTPTGGGIEGSTTPSNSSLSTGVA